MVTSSPPDLDVVLDRLRAQGGRVTAGRRAIVRALLTADDHHVTADALAATVQADHPDVHLSTVYRTLEALELVDVVDRINLGPGGAVYHLTARTHHHLVCDRCGSVSEADDAALDRLAADLRDRYGFALSPRHLTLHGRCRACQEKLTP